MIFHSAKALRSGVFVGWYKGTYENYYIYRSETPIYFYWYNTVFSLFGSFMIGLALYLLNGDYHFYRHRWQQNGSRPIQYAFIFDIIRCKTHKNKLTYCFINL